MTMVDGAVGVMGKVVVARAMVARAVVVEVVEAKVWGLMVVMGAVSADQWITGRMNAHSTTPTPIPMALPILIPAIVTIHTCVWQPLRLRMEPWMMRIRAQLWWTVVLPLI